MSYPVTRVSWLDHSEPSGPVWWDPADLPGVKPAVIDSVGFNVFENDEYLMLTTAVSDDGLVGRPLVILKAAIVSRG